LLAEGPQIDGFVLAEDDLLFGNDSATFEYPNASFDYQNTDPYLGISDTFYSKYLEDINFVLSAEQLNSINNGKRNLSWPAFVRTREENKAYITQSNGNKLAREEALIKWIENSYEEFQGNCYGMSLFALQNLSDPSLLLSRFGNIYSPSANAVDYEADNLPFKEMFASLQLQQLSVDLLDPFLLQNGLNGALADQNLTAIRQLMKPSIFEIVSGFKTGEADSSYLISFRARSANNLETFYHSVMPFKVTRNLTFGIPGDTLHCIDPNYPGNILDLYIDYNTGQSRAYVSGILVYFVDFAYNSSYLKKILPENPADFMTNMTTNGPKSAPLATYIHTSELCDFTLVNLDSGGEEVSVQGGNHSTTWTNMGAYYAMDQDEKVDKLITEGVANLSASISNCNDRNYYSYAYPGGIMVYERSNVLPSETDLISNNGSFLAVQNPDALSKTMNIMAINAGLNSETRVAIKDYELLANEEVSMEVLDSTHVLLSNSELDNKNYDLVLNYVDGLYQITRNIENIALASQTNHTILIQASMEGQEVIILVDEGQDGSVEDTLFDVLGPTSITQLDLPLAFEVYPNPTDAQFKIVFKDKNLGSYYLEIINGLGELVKKELLDLSIQQDFTIDLGTYSKGFYILQLKQADGHLVSNKKICLY
ncbi:MAG: T9SS type A sorting domain-containing protein, partial [Bacteroidetes bacterium]|nr:T9SS type A sorting domain-containing protein [Bacteroidota bacterium]